MKSFIFSLTAIAAFCLNLNAQNESSGSKTVTVVVKSELSKDTIKQAVFQEDTAIVRVGEKNIKVISHEGGTEIIWGKDKDKKDKSDRFNGHWEGIDFGFLDYDKVMYMENDFMELSQPKSTQINLNFYELNIGLQRKKKSIGLISGLGLRIDNYRFQNPYTLNKGKYSLEPVLLEYDNLSKSKLVVTYLSIPALFEFQIPVNHGDDHLYVNAGLIGNMRIGAHTKVKHGDSKDKNRSDFHIRPFNYSSTIRVGYKNVGLFFNYDMEYLLKDYKSPILRPISFGVSFN